MSLAQAYQILDRGNDLSPQSVVDQKSPGQIGLATHNPTRTYQSLGNNHALFY